MKNNSVPVYNYENLSHIPDSDIQFTINDGDFLEGLLLKIRGEMIKFATKQKTKMIKKKKTS